MTAARRVRRQWIVLLIAAMAVTACGGSADLEAQVAQLQSELSDLTDDGESPDDDASDVDTSDDGDTNDGASDDDDVRSEVDPGSADAICRDLLSLLRGEGQDLMADGYGDDVITAVESFGPMAEADVFYREDGSCELSGDSDVYLEVYFEEGSNGPFVSELFASSAYGQENLLTGEYTDYSADGDEGAYGPDPLIAAVQDYLDIGGCDGEGGFDMDEDGTPDYASYPLSDGTELVMVTCFMGARMPNLDVTYYDADTNTLDLFGLAAWDGETVAITSNVGGLFEYDEAGTGMLALFVPGSGGECGTYQRFFDDGGAYDVRECDPNDPDAPISDWTLVFAGYGE